MRIEFRRTGERRYVVAIHRAGPLGLQHGIFGFSADGDRSERAAYVCVYEWLRRSRDAERRARAADMADGVRVTLDGMSDEERRAYSEERLARVCVRMDELGGAWSRLSVGESLSVEWTA